MSVKSEKHESRFILSGVRQVTRILDIGLITPELVGCGIENKIAVLSFNELSSIHHVNNGPKIPILIKLKEQVDISCSVLSVDKIVSIHFFSDDEMQDYIDRAFENVPNMLFDILVTPGLFSIKGESVVEINFPKLDKKYISSKYRRVDMALGLMWQGISKSNSVINTRLLLESCHLFNPCADNSGQPYVNLVNKSSGINTEDDVNSILSEYFIVMQDYPIENGWASKSILFKLKGLYESHTLANTFFEKWYDVSLSIINNERELFPLSDEKHISLRAMLLHLISPDKESIIRFAQKNSDLGDKVLLVSNLLCAAREGYSAMSAKDKSENPGIFFLLSNIASRWLSNISFDSSELYSEVTNSSEVLKWNDLTIGEFNLTSSNDKQELTPKVDTKEENNNTDFLSDILNGLVIVSNLDVLEKDKILINLNSKELHNVKIPRHSGFVVRVLADAVIFSSCILNLETKSHLKRLTGPRMKSAFKYQGKQDACFRFNLCEDNLFSAEVSIPLQEIDTCKVKVALELLISSHVWMNGKAI